MFRSLRRPGGLMRAYQGMEGKGKEVSEERHQRARWKALEFSVRTLAFVKCDMGSPCRMGNTRGLCLGWHLIRASLC